MTDAYAASKPALRHRLEALAAHAVFAALRLLPTAEASAFGGWLGRTIGPRTPAHRTAARNMAHALPDLSGPERDAALMTAWDNFGRTMVEYAVLARFDR